MRHEDLVIDDFIAKVFHSAANFILVEVLLDKCLSADAVNFEEDGLIPRVDLEHSDVCDDGRVRGKVFELLADLLGAELLVPSDDGVLTALRDGVVINAVDDPAFDGVGVELGFEEFSGDLLAPVSFFTPVHEN